MVLNCKGISKGVRKGIFRSGREPSSFFDCKYLEDDIQSVCWHAPYAVRIKKPTIVLRPPMVSVRTKRLFLSFRVFTIHSKSFSIFGWSCFPPELSLLSQTWEGLRSFIKTLLSFVKTIFWLSTGSPWTVLTSSKTTPNVIFNKPIQSVSKGLS